jgi:hypothetical protein
MKVLVDDEPIPVEDMELGAKEKPFDLEIYGIVQNECPHTHFKYKNYELLIARRSTKNVEGWDGEITKIGDPHPFADAGLYRNWYNMLTGFRRWVDDGTMDAEYLKYKKEHCEFRDGVG